MKNIYKIIITLIALVPIVVYGARGAGVVKDVKLGALAPTGINQGNGFINPLRIGDRIEASYFIASSTTATSTFYGDISQGLGKILTTRAVRSDASAGVLLQANNYTNVGLFGAGNTSNSLFYGGVNIDGTTRLATSLNGCLSASSGTISASGSACGAGGGSGGGTWSTTTSTVAGRLINYSNNTTDIMAVGSNATTTAEFYYDPNTTKGFMQGSFVVGTAQPTYADDNLSVADFVTDINGYSFVGIQNKNAGTTASSDLVFANNKTTITDYYADCGISGGNNTDPLFTGIGGSNAFYCFNSDGPVSFGIGTSTSGSDFNFTVSSNGGTSYLTSDIKMKLTNGGNLGIGTTSPYAKLSVVGDSGVVAEKFVATSTTAFSTFGGRIGVSTTSPAQKIQIADGSLSITSASGQGRGLILSTDVMDDSARASISFLRNNFGVFTGDDHATQTFNFFSGFSATRAFGALLRVYGSETGGFSDFTGITHDGTDGNITTGVGDLVLIPATGRVSVGTTTPRGRLEITGDAVNTSNSFVVAPTGTSGNRTLWIDGSSLNARFTNQNIVSPLAHISLQSDGGSGNVGIGTTTPYTKLSVVGEVVASTFTATSTINKSTFVSASSTQLTVSDKLFATFSSSILLSATSSMGLGTTTYKFSGFSQDSEITEFGCTDIGAGTFQARLGDSTASTTLVTSSGSNTTTFTTLSANNIFTRGEAIYIEFGGVSGAVASPSCSYTRKTI